MLHGQLGISFLWSLASFSDEWISTRPVFNTFCICGPDTMLLIPSCLQKPCGTQHEKRSLAKLHRTKDHQESHSEFLLKGMEKGAIVWLPNTQGLVDIHLMWGHASCSECSADENKKLNEGKRERNYKLVLQLHVPRKQLLESGRWQLSTLGVNHIFPTEQNREEFNVLHPSLSLLIGTRLTTVSALSDETINSSFGKAD